MTSHTDANFALFIFFVLSLADTWFAAQLKKKVHILGDRVPINLNQRPAFVRSMDKQLVDKLAHNKYTAPTICMLIVYLFAFIDLHRGP